MLIINRPFTDPYFNIAAEEYLLKNADDDYFMLWVNEPSVIVGKHQNTFAEINHQYVKKKQIPVIRRISGGGTVFHDPGNLNYSFISKGEKGKLVDFQRFTQPIIDFLNEMGVPAKFEGKNDIRVDGFKISGNAEHVYRDKVLHHGTLLFSSELGSLNKAIKGNEKKYDDKAVKSVRSKVKNITDFLTEPLSIEEFKEMILSYIQKNKEVTARIDLKPKDIKAIELLTYERYRQWDWNYGYSPKFTHFNEFVFENELFEVYVLVENGWIQRIHLQNEKLKVKMNELFFGLPFDEIVLSDQLNLEDDLQEEERTLIGKIILELFK